ncbi:hypothetical protein IQ268_06140 [Oculatella sp. LEGE 06141]|uniref:hypothetical protein n=1 Tax=Oculatella sp. LEGE 06141 TaxID=1828648 RepID=UPI0018820780|nr:hypothetical protein [Oculatella sp. LEGE 06141]MBE9178163.1 hypothetical protein [Oculatella sp. LEGE 06141]
MMLTVVLVNGSCAAEPLQLTDTYCDAIEYYIAVQSKPVYSSAFTRFSKRLKNFKQRNIQTWKHRMGRSHHRILPLARGALAAPYWLSLLPI